MKKILLSLGTLATVAVPIVSVISCGTNKKDHSSDQLDGNKNPDVEAKDNEKAGVETPSKVLLDQIDSFKSLDDDQRDSFVSRVNREDTEEGLNQIKQDFINAIKEVVYAELDQGDGVNLETIRDEIGSSNSSKEIQEIEIRAKRLIRAKVISDALSYVENALTELDSEKKVSWGSKIQNCKEVSDIKDSLLNATKENAINIVNKLE